MAERRVSQAAPGGGATILEPPPMGSRAALIGFATFVAVLVGLGILAQQLLAARPAGSITACKTSPAVGRYLYSDPQPMCIDTSKSYRAVIHTTKGDLHLQLDPRSAPATVNNFVVLAVNHYYDGMRFWRIQDWMAQTGDPYDSGSWSPGYYLPEEGAVNPGWKQGDLGMARPPGGYVNGAQFFILKLPWPKPGPGAVYNRFGTVNSADNNFLQQLSGSDRIVYITVRQG